MHACTGSRMLIFRCNFPFHSELPSKNDGTHCRLSSFCETASIWVGNRLIKGPSDRNEVSEGTMGKTATTLTVKSTLIPWEIGCEFVSNGAHPCRRGWLLTSLNTCVNTPTPKHMPEHMFKNRRFPNSSAANPHITVRALPLEGKEEAPLEEGESILSIGNTGKVVLELMQNGSALWTYLFSQESHGRAVCLGM